MKVSHDSETPAHGQQIFSVCAFVHHNFDGVNKLFLPRRAKTKKFYPDVYELPGGHVDWVIYFATFVDLIENIKLDRDDHSEYKWLSEEELPQIYGIGGKDEDNPEVLAMKRGFELLNGHSSLNFD
jgi:hypothetical protein